MYPGKLYEEAARALIAKFPNLADSTGTGYALNLNDAEDEDSIAAHIAGMQKEMLKASPNYEYLMDSISRTYSERRLWISKEIPSVADVVEKYPALTTSTIVSIHIHLFPHGIDISIMKENLLAAVATQIALYWVFDIVFDPKAKKSLDLFYRAAQVDNGKCTAHSYTCSGNIPRYARDLSPVSPTGKRHSGTRSSNINQRQFRGPKNCRNATTFPPRLGRHLC
nr:uncharacterized protein LOC119179350 [Rhipicephalus microplus]